MSVLSLNCSAPKLKNSNNLECLRLISAYRTVSREAICALIKLVIKENEECYALRSTGNARSNIKAASVAKW